MQERRDSIHILSRDFFRASLATYILLILIETFDEGSVSNFFDMNYLLLVVVVSGVGLVTTEKEPLIKSVRTRVARIAQSASAFRPQHAHRTMNRTVRYRHSPYSAEQKIVDAVAADQTGRRTVRQPELQPDLIPHQIINNRVGQDVVVVRRRSVDGIRTVKRRPNVR